MYKLLPRERILLEKQFDIFFSCFQIFSGSSAGFLAVSEIFVFILLPKSIKGKEEMKF